VDRAIELLKFTGHIAHAGREEREMIAKRLALAAFWAQNYAPEDAKLSVNTELPRTNLGKKEKLALLLLLNALRKKFDEKELQARIYEIAREMEIEPKAFFRLLYQLLLNKDSGPRLGPFIVAVGKEKVISMLEALE
jgi:lysyl-tRNA synthetase class 1